MTSLVSAAGLTVADRARDVAAVAAESAASAGVVIRELHGVAQLEQVELLFGEIWQTGKEPSPVSRDLMRALAHAGNYVAGAFDGDACVAACVGFFGAPGKRTLHSHITGVARPAQGRSLGFAVKLHQHVWALEHGIREITWTFDPLVRRNGYFNLAKLGARPTAYLPDFYGAMSDGINAGQGSDRLYASWTVDRLFTAAGGAEPPPTATVLLEEGPGGEPQLRPGSPTATGYLVQVPRDIDDLRRRQPLVARSWRSAVRDVLCGLIDDGAQVTGFTRSGFYVVEHVERHGP